MKNKGYKKMDLSKKISRPSTYKLIWLLILLSMTASYSQTMIDIYPGESAQVVREHSVSILPITNVSIDIFGADSLFVIGNIDSFRVLSGTLKVKTYYSLFVPQEAPLGDLSIRVLIGYHADNVLSQSVNEDFIINTNVQSSIIANFSADIIDGMAPLTVNFTNESSGNIIGYVWEFGDETTSSDENPQHTYQEPGKYTVSLTIFNFTVQNKMIKQDYINVQQSTSLSDEVSIKPHEVFLGQNYPNPFNPTTVIKFSLPESEQVELTIYNALGQLQKILFKGDLSAGVQSFTWDGTDLRRGDVPSGVYYYTLKSSSFSKTKKMILMK